MADTVTIERVKELAETGELHALKLETGLSNRDLAKQLGATFNGTFAEACKLAKDRYEAAGNKVISDLTSNVRAALGAYKRQNDGLLKQLAKLQDANAVVADALAANVQPIAPLKYPKPSKAKGVDHAIFMLLSDVHVGEWVRGDETAGLAEYNYDVFLRRRDKLLEAFTNTVADFRRAYKADHLYILGLGDWVTGEDIFPMQPTRIDLPLQEQVMAGAQEMSRLVLAMAEQFTSTHIFLQWGNHGKERFTTNNNDIMCYRWLQMLLAEQDSIYVNVSPARFNAFTLSPKHGPLDFGGVNKSYEYLLLHGQEARRYMGFPWYGADRAVRRSSEMVGFVYRRAFIGHHHQYAQAPGWVANSSWVGGTEYSIGEMQGCARPSQTFLSFAPEYGIGYTLELYLDEAPKLQEPDQHGARVTSLQVPSVRRPAEPTSRPGA